MKHTLRHALLLLLILFSASAVEAHKGSVKGIVYDGVARHPLEGVNVYLKGLQASAVTDAFGAYFLTGVPEGKYTLIVSRLGYTPTEETIHVEDGITAEVTTSLKPAGVQLADVTINAQREQTQSTISGIDLQLRPVNTSQDLLRLVPGLFISQHQGGGKAEQMFLRGFDVDHGTDVAVNVDGMPVNMVSHAHGQGYADLHFLIPELVQDMSFGKGPYAMDKGNLATAGWVGFRTRNYLDNSFIKLEGGQYGYSRAVVGLDLLGKGAGNRTDGAYVAGEFAYNRGYFDAPQDFNRINLTGKYTKQIGKDKLFSLTLSGFRSRWDASGQVPDRAVAQGIIGRFGEIDGEMGSTSRYSINMQYTQSIGRNSSFKSNLYGGYYDFELYSNFTFFLKDSVNGDQIRQKEQRVFAGYNAEYEHRYSALGMRMKTTVGAGFRNDNTTGSELSHTMGMTTLLERLAYGDVTETNLWGYVNQTVHLLPQLVLQAGTRFDYFDHAYLDRLPSEGVRSSARTSAFSPKLGAYYNFGKEGRIYFNYGVGFHSNDTRVVVPQGGRDVLPLAHSYDLGVTVKPRPRLLLSGAVFLLDLDQEFVYVGDEGVVEPGGRTRRYGFDLSGRYEAAKWLYFDADLNYTHARSVDDPEGENYIPLAPRMTSIGGVTVRPWKSFSASMRYRHMGDRAANEDNTVVARGYNVADFAASYEKPRYQLGLQVQNLFNTTWNEAQFDTETRLRNEAAPVSEICFTPGTPFFVKLSATYKF
jgi:hypothetical protein